jgi:hypothetical protein
MTKLNFQKHNNHFIPIPVAAQWVCGRSLAGIEGSNPARGVDVYLSVVSFV